jgi:hypothetical protein
MAKSDQPVRTSHLEKEIGKPAVAVNSAQPYNSKGKKQIKVQSLVSAHLKHTGQFSGKLYEWPVAGSIALVDEDDVPAIIARRVSRKPCCGANQVGNVFQVIT